MITARDARGYGHIGIASHDSFYDGPGGGGDGSALRRRHVIDKFAWSLMHVRALFLAWIDVVQDGGYARSIGSTGRSDCSGLRKSVRFELSAVPFVVQLSGVATDSVIVAISRAN